MTTGYFRYSLCLLLLLALVSCAGVPTAGTTPAEPAVAETSATAGAAEPLAQSVAMPESGEAAADSIDTGTTDAVVTEPPMVSEAVPVLPPPEKIISFYPEPEGLLILGTGSENVENAQGEPQSEPVSPPSPQSPPAPSKATAAAPAVPVPAAPAQKTPSPAQQKPAPSATTAPVTEPESAPGGIWTAEGETPSTSLSLAEDPPPSRTASLAKGETLEVRYPGTGWVYLGTADTARSLRYESRSQDRDGTVFLFRSLEEGVFNLAFSRFDVLTDSFTQDTLAVTVTAPIEGLSSASTVRSPDFKATSPSIAVVPPVSAAPSAASTAYDEEPSIRLASAASATLPASAQTEITGDMFAGVRTSLASGDVPAALSLLDSITTTSSDRPDEVLFLRAQAYEAPGNTRDIRKSLETYETLLKEFPESAFWKEADVRSRYIRRFYLQIR